MELDDFSVLVVAVVEALARLISEEKDDREEDEGIFLEGRISGPFAVPDPNRVWCDGAFESEGSESCEIFWSDEVDTLREILRLTKGPGTKDDRSDGDGCGN